LETVLLGVRKGEGNDERGGKRRRRRRREESV
jgi:hypothetical protein